MVNSKLFLSSSKLHYFSRDLLYYVKHVTLQNVLNVLRHIAYLYLHMLRNTCDVIPFNYYAIILYFFIWRNSKNFTVNFNRDFGSWLR